MNKQEIETTIIYCFSNLKCCTQKVNNAYKSDNAYLMRLILADMKSYHDILMALILTYQHKNRPEKNDMIYIRFGKNLDDFTYDENLIVPIDLMQIIKDVINSTFTEVSWLNNSCIIDFN